MGNWTTEPESIVDFQEVLKDYKKKKTLFLEIGSYDGTSAIGLITLISQHKESRVVCIDPFLGSREEFIYEAGPEATLLKNIKSFSDKIHLIKDKSETALIDVIKNLKEKFDVIYIDGCHDSKNVLEDAVLSFQALKDGGFLIFDDWEWNLDGVPQHQPQIAIQAFVDCYKDFIEIHKWNYRVYIKKIRS